MRVLLVEPDKVLASIYSQALEQAGHVVEIAADAQLAIDAADSQLPELVILELQLIEHNGVEFLYEFRSYPEWQHVPVIINTWVPLEATTDEQLRRSLGVAAYHYKPQTSLRQLLHSVSEAKALVT